MFLIEKKENFIKDLIKRKKFYTESNNLIQIKMIPRDKGKKPKRMISNFYNKKHMQNLLKNKVDYNIKEQDKIKPKKPKTKQKIKKRGSLINFAKKRASLSPMFKMNKINKNQSNNKKRGSKRRSILEFDL